LRLWEQYIHDVTTGKRIASKLERLAVDRFISDIEKSKGDWRYYFDEEIAEWVIGIAKAHRHTAGSFAGRKFDLQPFQAFDLVNLFAWLDKKTKFRRFFKSYVEMPRGGGKSEYACLVLSIMFRFDGEIGNQCYIGATTRSQCNYVFDPLKYMYLRLQEEDEDIEKHIDVMANMIRDNQTNSYVKTMTADPTKNDGGNPHCAIIDEYHEHETDGVVKIIEQGAAKRDQPLIFIITTAGFDKDKPCFEFREVCINILNGTVENDNIFAHIFTVDEGDDIHDPNTWHKANPNLGNAPKLHKFKTLYENAMVEGESALIHFLTKNLNVWCDTATTWIKDDDWKKCAKPRDKSELIGKPVILGLDLSLTTDITARAALYPSYDDKKPYLTMAFFCPSAKVEGVKRADGVDYRAWAKQGFIEVTEGNVIDYDFVEGDILEFRENNKIIELQYDAYNSHDLISRIEAVDVKCNPHPQSPVGMNMSVKRFYKMVVDEEIEHDGNPVMSWMIRNCEIIHDSNGNEKITKRKNKKRRKVDGVIAAVMALTTLMFPPEEDKKSIYEDRDLLIL
jgi:phage terminase large subunit-like protein